LKRIQVTESLQQCDLDYVFRILTVAKDSLGTAKNSLRMWHHKILKCRQVAGPCASQKCLLCRYNECRLEGILSETFAHQFDRHCLAPRFVCFLNTWNAILGVIRSYPEPSCD
jgi:hypothetical protein